MEEFDALMIRVNNIYYGRGKLIMSPENPSDKLEAYCDSSHSTPELTHGVANNRSGAREDRKTTDTQSNEIANSISVNKPSSGQVIVVDNVVNLSQDAECLGFEGSRKGHDSFVAVDLEMTDDLHDNHGTHPLRFIADSKTPYPKPLAKSKSEGYGGLDLDKTDSRYSSKTLGQRPGNRSIKSMVGGKDLASNISVDSRVANDSSVEGVLVGISQGGQISENKQRKNLASKHFTKPEKKIQDFKPAKIDEKLLNNPWLSGEIAERSDAQQWKSHGTIFRDVSLILRDKFKQWKSDHDLHRTWEELQREVPVEEQKSKKSRINGSEKDSSKNEITTVNSVEEEERSKTRRHHPNWYETKICTNEYGDLQDGIETSNAEKFCLARSKQKCLSSSHGNLSSLLFEKMPDIKVNEKDMSRDDSNLRRFFEPVANRLKPAKSLGELIGHFESCIDEKKIKQHSFQQDKPDSKKQLSCLEGKVMEKRVEDHDDYQCGVHFGKQHPADNEKRHHLIMREINFNDESLEDGIKDGTSSKGVKCHLRERGDGGDNVYHLATNRQSTFDAKDSKRASQERPETVQSLNSKKGSVPDADQPFADVSPYDTIQDVKDRVWQRGVMLNKARTAFDGAKLIGRSNALERNIQITSMTPSDSFTDAEVFKAKSTPDLTQNEEQQSGRQSFFKERFKRAALRSRLDEPSFEARMMKWRSLDELRMKFEANENESLEEGDFECFDERVQQAIIDGMTKYAEQKFGRKRAAPKSSKGARSAMDDYEIYLRSLRSKVKTSQDKLNIVNKQKREIEEKVKKAEQEVEKQEKTLQDAEDEKRSAEREGRDPKLPSGFVVPQTAKKAVAGAGFANLVMKASAQLWEDKFMAMRAKKGGSEGQPEWMTKSKRSDKILLNVGKKGGHKKEEEQKPAWSANLKKAEPRKKIESKHDEQPKAAFANVSLRKTTKKEDDEDTGSKKIDWKEMEKKSATTGSSRRRRGGDDSD